jgi:hypothetical protein
MNNRRKPYQFAAAVIAALSLTGATAHAQSYVAAPESLPLGMSYQQWSANWWQWVMAIPYNMNPIFDTTGADCGLNQSGPVWFLAGTSGFSATRYCTVPAGKMIFFPINNYLNDYPCYVLPATGPFEPPFRVDPNFQPGPGQSLEQFLTIGYGPHRSVPQIDGARPILDQITALSAALDGVPVSGLSLPPLDSKYRATSPLFEFDGDRSLLQFDPCTGPGHLGVSDGYWVMLNPLTPGPHTLTFSGTRTNPTGSFAVTVTFHLTISRI